VISGGLPGDFIVYRHRAFRKTLVGFAHPGGTNIWSGSWTNVARQLVRIQYRHICRVFVKSLAVRQSVDMSL